MSSIEVPVNAHAAAEESKRMNPMAKEFYPSSCMTYSPQPLPQYSYGQYGRPNYPPYNCVWVAPLSIIPIKQAPVHSSLNPNAEEFVPSSPLIGEQQSCISTVSFGKPRIVHNDEDCHTPSVELPCEKKTVTLPQRPTSRPSATLKPRPVQPLIVEKGTTVPESVEEESDQVQPTELTASGISSGTKRWADLCRAAASVPTEPDTPSTPDNNRPVKRRTSTGSENRTPVAPRPKRHGKQSKGRASPSGSAETPEKPVTEKLCTTVDNSGGWKKVEDKSGRSPKNHRIRSRSAKNQTSSDEPSQFFGAAKHPKSEQKKGSARIPDMESPSTNVASTNPIAPLVPDAQKQITRKWVEAAKRAEANFTKTAKKASVDSPIVEQPVHTATDEILPPINVLVEPATVEPVPEPEPTPVAELTPIAEPNSIVEPTPKTASIPVSTSASIEISVSIEPAVEQPIHITDEIQPSINVLEEPVTVELVSEPEPTPIAEPTPAAESIPVTTSVSIEASVSIESELSEVDRSGSGDADTTASLLIPRISSRGHVVWSLQTLLDVRMWDKCCILPSWTDSIMHSVEINDREMSRGGPSQMLTTSCSSSSFASIGKGGRNRFTDLQYVWDVGNAMTNLSKCGSNDTPFTRAMTGSSDKWSSLRHARSADYQSGGKPEPMAADEWSKQQDVEKASGDELKLAVRKLRSLLNRLSIENFDAILAEMLPIATKDNEIMQAYVNLIFEKACTQHKYINMYTTLCLQLNAHLMVSEPEGTAFKKLVLVICQKHFNEYMEAEYVADPNADEEDQFEAYLKFKARLKGCVMFAGALARMKLLNWKAIAQMVQWLHSSRKTHQLEALAALLPSVHELVQSKRQGSSLLAGLLAETAALLKDESIEYRIRCLLQDGVEQRKSGVSSDAPTTLENVRREVELSHQSSSSGWPGRMVTFV